MSDSPQRLGGQGRSVQVQAPRRLLKSRRLVRATTEQRLPLCTPLVASLSTCLNLPLRPARQTLTRRSLERNRGDVWDLRGVRDVRGKRSGVKRCVRSRTGRLRAERSETGGLWFVARAARAAQGEEPALRRSQGWNRRTAFLLRKARKRAERTEEKPDAKTRNTCPIIRFYRPLAARDSISPFSRIGRKT